MTRAPFVMPKADAAWSRRAEVHDTTIGWRFVNPRMEERYGTDSMPGTAQIVADEYGVSREDQDAFALRSQERAAKAISSGSAGAGDRPRRGAGQEGASPWSTPMSTLGRPPSRRSPRCGRSSPVAASPPATPLGINDGAAALLVASEEAVSRFGLTPMARVTTSLSVGVEPRVMGIGPDPAVKALLARTGFKVGDIDLFELNEAFASQSLAVLRALGLPDDAEHVNPNGGAIALGHPPAERRPAGPHRGRRARGPGRARAVATMCIGVGQGGALLLEAVR